MTCPLCQRSKGRRLCPALEQTICATCCGTKRQREIACPESCAYLQSARVNPPAAVKRQRERDAEFLIGLLQGLTETQYRLWLALQSIVRRHQADAIPALHDADVADAARALAATYETAQRGIIYEHPTASLPAQRVLQELRDQLQRLSQQAPSAAGFERDAATAARRLERGAARAAAALGGGESGFLEFLDRTIRPGAADAGPPTPPEPDDGPQERDTQGAPASRIILP